MPTTWNPSDKATTFTLSNGNRTFAQGTNNDQFVRSVASRKTGKFYAELNRDSGTAADGRNFGISTSGVSVNGLLGTGLSWGFLEDGRIFTGGSAIQSSYRSSYAANDRQCIAVDLDAQLFWARYNNGNWNNSGTADPATGTGGKSLSSIGTAGTVAIYLAGGIYSAGPTSSLKSAASEWTYTAPSGFGEFSQNAAASQTTQLPSNSQTASVKVNAAQSKTTVAPSQTATAGVTVSAVESAATAAPSQTAVAAVKVSAAESATTAAPAQAATAASTVTASESVTTAAPVQSATAGVTVSASASQTTATPTQTATATLGALGAFAASQTTAAPSQTATAAATVTASASQAVPLPSTAETAAEAVAASQSVTTDPPSQVATYSIVREVVADQVTELPTQVATWQETPFLAAFADQLTVLPGTDQTMSPLVFALADQALGMPSQAANVGWAHEEASHGNDKLWRAGRTSRVVASVRNSQRGTPYAPQEDAPMPPPAVETSVALWRAGRTARVMTKVRSTIASRAAATPFDPTRQASVAANQDCLLPMQAGAFEYVG